MKFKTFPKLFVLLTLFFELLLDPLLFALLLHFQLFRSLQSFISFELKRWFESEILYKILLEDWWREVSSLRLLFGYFEIFWQILALLGNKAVLTSDRRVIELALVCWIFVTSSIFSICGSWWECTRVWVLPRSRLFESLTFLYPALLRARSGATLGGLRPRLQINSAHLKSECSMAPLRIRYLWAGY